MTMVLKWIRDTVFEDKMYRDFRVPNLVFEIPYFQRRIGLVGFNPWYWVQLFTLVSMQTVINVMAALVIYDFIIVATTKNRSQGVGLTPYLVGYGLVCPFMMAFPFWFITVLDLRNKAMCVGAAASSVLLFLRCIEAMHDSVPVFATKSRSSFILYYTSTVQFAFDPRTGQVKRVTFSDVVHKFTNFVSLFIQAAAMFSLLYPVGYELLPITEGTSFLGGVLAHLINNFAMASLTSICLDVGATGIGLGITLLTGIYTVDLNDHPLTKSQSASEFWNKRWNTLVSHGLKRAVFIPLRKNGCSKPLAALATFTASGLIHEYILIIISYWEIVETGHVLFSGTHLAFFAWNGVVLVLEHFCKDHAVLVWMSKTFPPPIKTALVILTVLPLAHLFTQIYADSGFYTQYGLGFPRIEYIG